MSYVVHLLDGLRFHGVIAREGFLRGAQALSGPRVAPLIRLGVLGQLAGHVSLSEEFIPRLVRTSVPSVEEQAKARCYHLRTWPLTATS